MRLSLLRSIISKYRKEGTRRRGYRFRTRGLNYNSIRKVKKKRGYYIRGELYLYSR